MNEIMHVSLKSLTILLFLCDDMTSQEISEETIFAEAEKIAKLYADKIVDRFNGIKQKYVDRVKEDLSSQTILEKLEKELSDEYRNISDELIDANIDYLKKIGVETGSRLLTMMGEKFQDPILRGVYIKTKAEVLNAYTAIRNEKGSK
jgi:hypothetical protein